MTDEQPQDQPNPQTLGFDGEAQATEQAAEPTETPAGAAILTIPDHVAEHLSPPPVAHVLTETIALADALRDILPTHWDPAHPSADLFARAREALDAYEASIT